VHSRWVCAASIRTRVVAPEFRSRSIRKGPFACGETSSRRQTGHDACRSRTADRNERATHQMRHRSMSKDATGPPTSSLSAEVSSGQVQQSLDLYRCHVLRSRRKSGTLRSAAQSVGVSWHETVARKATGDTSMTRPQKMVGNASKSASGQFLAPARGKHVRLSDPDVSKLLDEEIASIRRDPDLARQFLKDSGLHTPSGRLARKYGGA
jgi:hypothetical protein